MIDNNKKESERELISLSEQEAFFYENNITDSDLIKAKHYALVCSRCDGLNIRQASNITGIPFSTLHDELKVWEFAGLIKLTRDIQNGRTVVLIHTLIKSPSCVTKQHDSRTRTTSSGSFELSSEKISGQDTPESFDNSQRRKKEELQSEKVEAFNSKINGECDNENSI